MLARRLLSTQPDPYWEHVVFLLQPSPSALVGSTDYFDARGAVLSKCSAPVVGTVGGLKSINFDGLSYITFPVGAVHSSPIANVNRNGLIDTTFEWAIDYTVGTNMYLYVIGSTWNSSGSILDNCGGMWISINTDGRIHFYAGNWRRDGKLKTAGLSTVNAALITSGRHDITIRVGRNILDVYVDGEIRPTANRETSYGTNLDDIQAYVPRYVNICSAHKIECSIDTTTHSSSYISGVNKLYAMRVTRGVLRPVSHPFILPFMAGE